MPEDNGDKCEEKILAMKVWSLAVLVLVLFGACSSGDGASEDTASTPPPGRQATPTGSRTTTAAIPTAEELAAGVLLEADLSDAYDWSLSEGVVEYGHGEPGVVVPTGMAATVAGGVCDFPESQGTTSFTEPAWQALTVLQTEDRPPAAPYHWSEVSEGLLADDLASVATEFDGLREALASCPGESTGQADNDSYTREIRELAMPEAGDDTYAIASHVQWGNGEWVAQWFGIVRHGDVLIGVGVDEGGLPGTVERPFTDDDLLTLLTTALDRLDSGAEGSP